MNEFSPPQIAPDEESESFRIKTGLGFNLIARALGVLKERFLSELALLKETIIKPALRGGFAISDVRYFGTIANAIANIPTSTAFTLYITNAQTLTASLTIPSNISLVILKGGSISGAYTLTINGPFEAGLMTVFGTTLTVVFGVNSVRHVLPQWWGALGDGSTNDTTAITSAQATGRPVFYNTYFRVEDNTIRNRMFHGNVAIERPEAKPGNPTLRIKKWYTMFDTEVTDQTTYAASGLRFVVEQGDYIAFRIRFRGFINQVKFNLRSETTSLETVTTSLVGSTPASAGRKAAYTGDNQIKDVVVFVDRVNGSYAFDDGVVTRLTVSLNTEVADQDATFDILGIYYAWVNSKNVEAVPSSTGLGWKGISLRNWNDGTNFATGQSGNWFMDSDAQTEYYIQNITKLAKLYNLDWIRFPVMYKYLYNSGTIRHDLIQRVVRVLDHCATIGLPVYIVLNHSLTAEINKDRWVRVEDVDTGAKRTTMANSAAAVMKYFVEHKAIKMIDLHNEINDSLVELQHDSVIYTYYPFDDCVDYIEKLATSMRTITSKPLSVSGAGGLLASWLFSDAVTAAIDVVDWHMYGVAFSKIPYNSLNRPMVSSESEGDNHFSWFRDWSEVAGAWHTYVDDFWGSGSSYDPAQETGFKAYDVKPTKEFPAFVNQSVSHSGALATIDETGGHFVHSLIPGLSGWVYDKVTAGWLAVIAAALTTNTLPKWTATGFADSQFSDDGTTPTVASRLQVTVTSTNQGFRVTGAAGINRAVRWETSSNRRFQAYIDGTTESGSNVGSDWFLARYDDAGAFIDNPIKCERSTGDITIAKQTTFGGLTHRYTVTGLTAATTQTQGQGALTREINVVSTCANANDVVTLPAAVAGRKIYIRNNGAQTLQIFPASGDAINGAAADASVTLAAGASVTYHAGDATNWWS